MDPVLRCDSCKKLVRVDYLDTRGGCPCGSRRMVEVRSLSQVEMAKLEQEFPDFAAVFTADYGDVGAFV